MYIKIYMYYILYYIFKNIYIYTNILINIFTYIILKTCTILQYLYHNNCVFIVAYFIAGYFKLMLVSSP